MNKQNENSFIPLWAEVPAKHLLYSEWVNHFPQSHLLARQSSSETQEVFKIHWRHVYLPGLEVASLFSLVL